MLVNPRPCRGEARSTVFLDSCSTGGTPTNGGAPLAQLVAEALPGVEIHAFEDIMYPKHVTWQSDVGDRLKTVAHFLMLNIQGSRLCTWLFPSLRA